MDIYTAYTVKEYLDIKLICHLFMFSLPLPFIILSFILYLEGMDRDNAFTVKDSKRTFTGDQALRRQLTTPKDDLGYCAPLALETGGEWGA